MSSMKSVSQEPIASIVPASPVIQILQTQPIQSFALSHYLWERRIPLHVAQRYCTEAQYIIDEKTYYALGLRNNAGGYHLANRYHEYAAGPQTLTFISSRSTDIAIFTHPLSLLTLASLLYYSGQALPDLLVIPDPAYLDSAQVILSIHRRKHLFPDHNPTGLQIVHSLSSQPGFIDHSPLYRAYKTLTHFSCYFGKHQPT